jgi:type I restriction enzyme S subunit
MRDGWVETSLVEVFESCKNGKNYKEDENQRGLPITRIQTIADGTINLQKVGFGNLEEVDCLDFLLREGDILFSHINSLPHVGKVAYVTDEHLPLVHGMNLLRMRFKSSCDSKFMFYLMQHLDMREKVRSIAQIAVNQVSVNITNLKLLPILLPQLSEQKRIADLISSVDSYIEALKKQLESAKILRNAVLLELLTAGGDDWVEATLGEMISYSIGGIWGDELGNSEIDVPVYRQTEFNDSGILTTPADAYRSISKSQLESRTLKHGDILIQKSAGTPTLPGRVVMVPDLGQEKATFSNFLNLLRPDQTKCISRFVFLHFWLMHKSGGAFEFQRGTNIKNLDLPSYLKEKIILPPLTEQKRIVEIITTFDAILSQTELAINYGQYLRSGLLSDLLGGQHEIPASYDKVIGAA